MVWHAKSRGDALNIEAHAWWVRPESLSANDLSRRCLDWLAVDERAVIQHLTGNGLQHLHLVSRALCRALLSQYTDVEPQTLVFVRGPHGKPVIVKPARCASLHFNLTHTKGFVGCVVSRAGEVGIDAEEISRRVDVDRVSAHFFSPAEREAIARLPKFRRLNRFYEYWVLKEAYLKGLGTGLSRKPDQFTINLGRDGQPTPMGRWQLALHKPGPRHAAATAVRVSRGAPIVPIVWREFLGLYRLASPSKADGSHACGL